MKLEEKELTLFDTTVTLNEYLLIISPPQKVRKDVKQFKQQLGNLCGRFDAQFSQAHFSLINIYLPSEKEKALLLLLKEGISSHKKFEISIKNFGIFETSRTIYLNPTNGKVIGKLTLSIVNKLFYNQLVLKRKQITHWKIPHLTIGKKLNQIQFKVAWQEFSQLTYDADFQVNELVLLKRVNHGPYKKFRSFHLSDA